MRFDDILEQYVGEFGPYQKRIYALMCLPAILSACLGLQPVFLLAVPNHRCHIPNLPNDTYDVQSETHQELISLSIPLETNQYGVSTMSKCLLYDTGNLSANDLGMWGEPNSSTSKIKCNDWVFDGSTHVTIITKYQMVCDNSILQSHFMVITFVGGLCGSFSGGILSDLYGRKTMFLSCIGLYMLGTLGLLFLSPIFEVLLAMRFFQGVTGILIYITFFTYVLEMVGPNYRMFVGMTVSLFWCLGLFLLVGISYFVRDWVHQTLIISLPSLFLLSYYWLVPESPRWLIAKGYTERAEKILHEIAEVNGTCLPDKLVEKVVASEADNQKSDDSGKIWKLFLNKSLLTRILVISVNKFALNIAYYGISLNVKHLSGNLYLNYTVSCTVETGSMIIITLMIGKLGRKPLFIGSQLLGALGFLATAPPIFFGGKDDLVWSVAMAMVGKTGVSGAYAVMYIYGSEVFPTSLRNTALGLCVVIELQGGIIAPYLVELSHGMGEKAGAAFPMLVFGAVSLVASVLALLLPETRNKQLPETIEDANKFGTYQEF